MGYLDYAGLQYLWGKLKEKFAPKTHIHDDRYYTESEINTKLASKAESIVLASNANLNNITTPGIYSCGGGNSITNKPSGLDAIGLIVIHNASGAYYIQILTTSTNANTYRRTCMSGTWSAWTQDKYTDTNTWRGIQNNLTSDSTTDSLSAAQGKALKTLVDGKAASGHIHLNGTKSGAVDWNTLITFGTYKIQNCTMTDAYHAPASEYAYGILQVLDSENGASEKRIIQIYWPHNTNKGNHLWYRMHNSSDINSGWSSWTAISKKPATAGTADIANAVEWSNVKNKPSTFTPSDHNQAWSTITGKPALMESGDYSSETIEAFLKKVQGVSPRMGSANFTKEGTRIANAWYNFIYTPHRTGVGDDNPDYGTLMLFPLNFSGSSFIIRAAKDATVSEVRKIYTSGDKPTKADVGLGNVDNTADANKSVKYATSAGTASKATSADSATTATKSKSLQLLSSTRPTSMNVNLAGADYLGKVTYTLATSSTTTGKPPVDSGVLNFSWDNNGWGAQVAVANNNNPRMYVRGAKGSSNTSTWDTAWKTVAYIDDKPSAAGTADTAKKLSTSAGSATQPVYFSSGKPVACSYTLGKSVPSNAVFTDTNTWRGIQNNLTSDSTTDSLSAAQGKVLKGYVDAKLPLAGGTMTGRIIRNGGGGWIKDREQVAIFNSTKPDSNNYRPVVGQKTPSGAWTMGAYTGEELIFDYTTDTNYNAGTNQGVQVKLPAQAGTIITSATIGSQTVATAGKLSSSAGSATQPIYFKDGKPTACSYTLNKSVPSDAKFTDTNTWRGVQNNLTSTATDQSLSAAMGKKLQDEKAPASGSNNYVRVYNSANVGNSSSVTFNDLAKQHCAVAMINSATDNPLGKASWVHALSMAWSNNVNTSWVSQLGIGTSNGTGMWYRTTSGSIVGRGWTRVYDSSYHPGADNGMMSCSMSTGGICGGCRWIFGHVQICWGTDTVNKTSSTISFSYPFGTSKYTVVINATSKIVDYGLTITKKNYYKFYMD